MSDDGKTPWERLTDAEREAIQRRNVEHIQNELRKLQEEAKEGSLFSRLMEKLRKLKGGESPTE